MSFIAKFLPSLVPGLSALANPWVLLVIGVVAGGVWFTGYSFGRDALDDYIKDQAKAAVVVITKQGAVTTRVVTKYIKVKGDTEIVIRDVEKEVIRYAETNPDGLCIDADWRRVHDRAALNAAAAAAPGADGTLRAPGRDPGGIRFPYRVPSAPERDGELREASPLRGPAFRGTALDG